MFSSPKLVAVFLIAASALSVRAQDRFHGVGRAATPKEVAAWDIDVRPDFKGLPAGKVNVEGRGKQSPVTGDSCTSKSKRELIVCLAPDRRVEVKVQGVSEVQQ